MAAAMAFGAFLAWIPSSAAQASAVQTNIVVLVVRGTVEISPRGSDRWLKLQAGETLSAGDRVRVGARSQLGVRLADQSLARFDEQTIFEVQEPRTPGGTGFRARVVAGLLYFFHRDKPSQLEVETRLASAAVRGTEFALRVEEGVTILTVIDGEVEMSNPLGRVTLLNGTEGVAREGQAPVRRPALDVPGTIQWTLYYPGVLDLSELGSVRNEALSEALKAFAEGNLLQAAQGYPWDRPVATDEERVFRAALLLSAGQAAEASSEIAAVGQKNERTARLAQALRTMVEIVQRGRAGAAFQPESATEWLVESYRLQAERQLEEALTAARKSAERSPNFSFAWARAAELEFSFGRIEAAAAAAKRALELAPKNAQALALDGFLLAARNRTAQALERFEEAMAADPGLANAWLGRGLTRIRIGQLAAGKSDLIAAAALEPRRAVLRSYLGKAWVENRQSSLAEHELDLAKNLDPLDPTPWLYSALLKEQQNRINEAVRELEHAQALNTNRAVYRSSFLLDQDRAVRSANLARLYRDAGLTDWSVREASRAVSADYANYSAHLFLAESYGQLIDPQLVNLRYETAALGEYLVGNLLSPANAGILSPTISEGEFSPLFERNRLGFVSITDYLSRGALRQSAAQYGNFGRFSYNLEAYYQHDPGERPNNDLEVENYSLQLKQQITGRDSLYFHISMLDMEAGDVFDRYDPSTANPSFRLAEQQEPWVGLGYHREWSPQSHTLLFATRISDDVAVEDLFRPSLFVRHLDGPIIAVEDVSFDGRYYGQTVLYSGEAQQIWTQGKHQAVAGVRAQTGEIETGNLLNFPSNFHEYFPPFGEVVLDEHARLNFHRQTAYAYYTWKPVGQLALTAGLAYDHMAAPKNFTGAPVSEEIAHVDELSPKAGLAWLPGPNSAVRFGYARSLTGASLDQSLRIEPTQVAGFNQAFRSVVPESLGGSVPGEEVETISAALEHRFHSETFVGLTLERLSSSSDHQRGAFEIFPFLFLYAYPSILRELTEFTEESVSLSVNQLLGEGFAVGLQYRLASAAHEASYPEVPQDPWFGVLRSSQRNEAVLHTIAAQGVFNHRSGFFCGVLARWTGQDIESSGMALPFEEFWQVDAHAGYRFWRRKAELSAGVLNIGDQDYRLLPVNFYSEPPRERTLFVRLRVQL